MKGSRLERVRNSPNYVDGRFVNPVSTRMMTGEEANVWQMAKRWVTENKDLREPKQPVPVQEIDPDVFAHSAPSGVRLFWLGHATVLVEIDGYRVLTDPMLGPRSSPVAWAGPKRFAPPPIRAEALPPLDAVLVSHDHYDHLDEDTVRALAKKGTPFCVPLGVGAHLVRWGVLEENIVELDWWGEALLPGKPEGEGGEEVAGEIAHGGAEEASAGGLRLVATPGRHFSGRGAFDRDETLWATWAVIGPQHRVFFGGDTGIFDGLGEIGAKYGPFNVTLMPIGAYDPAWAEIHLNPEEAVQAHLDVRGEVLLSIHWGTFNLAYHPWTEPIERLLAAAQARGIRVATPIMGQPITLFSEWKTEAWWRVDGASAIEENVRQEGGRSDATSGAKVSQPVLDNF